MGWIKNHKPIVIIGIAGVLVILLVLLGIMWKSGGKGTVSEEETIQCTVTISCEEVLDHMGDLKPEKAGLVPEDGILLETTMTVTKGETAFDVLRKACTDAGISLDATGGYVKGIQNLYEFDCGSNSGWKYTVNGMFPNYGSNAYVLEEGDNVLWNFACE